MRILVIEDDHKVANAIKSGLEHESYAVDVVYNGRDGYDYAQSRQHDLIVLDRMLPILDGTSICKKLRKKNIHIPILMLTAKGQVADRVEGLNAGADDYLVKPFAFSELLARIKALVRRPKSSIGNLYNIGDLSLDTVTYDVKRAGKSIQLSGKEYALLEFLMRHKNTILTKDQIMNNVWDYDAEVLPNSVEVYIRHLRNKIDKPFQAMPLIKTIRGFGYKISED